ncbi:MAG: DUF167 domain-containing protein [Leptospira sp.]|nr:DUF167 domain-containing protein [Leptospira sp.]
MILIVHAKPNSKKPGIQKVSESEWIVRIQAPAVDGKANAELIERIALEFNVAKSNVEILKGGLGKKKKVQVHL